MNMNLVNVVGVQFRRAGKIYDFSAGDHTLRVGDQVVVETDRGPSLAQVARLQFQDSSKYEEQGLKSVLRRATDKDLDISSRLNPEKAMSVAAEKVAALKLDMRVMKAEVQLGGNKAVIYFTAPGRVDFRDLVKDLASSLKTRVELKQVGSRDEAKLIGGLGICGREFCCSSFLREFVPVSIKMAKNQNLALNPTKISGGCGRLLCCLTYEDKTYKSLAKLIPSRGTRMRVIEDGLMGDVLKGDIINQTVLLELEDGRQASYKLSALESAKAEVSEVAQDSWGDDLNLLELTEIAEKSTPRKESKDSSARSREASSDSRRGNKRGSGPHSLRQSKTSADKENSSSDRTRTDRSSSGDASRNSENGKRRRGGRSRKRKPKKS